MISHHVRMAVADLGRAALRAVNPLRSDDQEPAGEETLTLERASSAAWSETVLMCMVVPLMYELLDAHTDTMELAEECGTTADLDWRAHLAYLRDLQRHGREALARMTPQFDMR